MSQREGRVFVVQLEADGASILMSPSQRKTSVRLYDFSFVRSTALRISRNAQRNCYVLATVWMGSNTDEDLKFACRYNNPIICTCKRFS